MKAIVFEDIDFDKETKNLNARYYVQIRIFPWIPGFYYTTQINCKDKKEAIDVAEKIGCVGCRVVKS